MSTSGKYRSIQGCSSSSGPGARVFACSSASFISPAPSLPMSALDFTTTAQEGGGSAREMAKSPRLGKVGTGIGSFGCGINLQRGGMGQERSETTPVRSDPCLEFAARSGFSRGGGPGERCDDRVSAGTTCRMRGMARLPEERSRPGPVPVRACAGHSAPMHGLVRPRRFVHPSNPAPARPARYSSD